MKVEYEVIRRSDVDDSVRAILAEMLRKQGKVQGDLSKKADRCKLICLARINGATVGVGAIKPKTASDFTNDKACVPQLSDEFQLELGYVYTDPEYVGRGIASNVVNLLVEQCASQNLMASTEIAGNPPMVRILEKRGFRLFGTPWKSAIHGQYLGLFLKFPTQAQSSEPKGV